MSQLSNDYEALYQQTLQNQQSTEDYIVENDLVSAYTRKLIDTTRSAKEQLAILEKTKLNKELDVTGYLRGSVVSMSDADSGFFDDNKGQRHAFRFADFNPIDAIDKKEARLASDYKSRLQPATVADLTGKPIDQLIEQDFINVANYQYGQNQGSLSNKDYRFSPYDPTQTYAPPNQEQSPIPFAYKIVGKDEYDRLLIEAINPETGRQVSFDMSNNPYLNSSFDLYKSINTKRNRRRLEEYQQKHKDYTATIADAFDRDGRLGEDLDLIQASAYRSAARLLQYGPDFLVDSEKWARIANAETGQALADAWAGVKTSTRREFAKGMTEASDAWDNGDYVDAILGWGSQLDRVLSESAVQMGLVAAGTVATGGVLSGTALAGTTAAKVGSMLMGASLGSTDVTLSMIEEYKANNNGNTPDAEEIASMWVINTALLMPEALMAGINIGKVLPKNVASKLNIAYQMKALPSRAKIVGASALEEVIQEAFQESFETYGSQKGGMFNGERKFWSDILLNEGIKAGVIGGMAGGSLSLAVQGSTTPFAYHKEKKLTEARAKAQKDFEETTNIGTIADKELSNTIVQGIQDFPTSTKEERLSTLAELDTALAIPNLSQAAQRLLLKKKNDVIFEMAANNELDENTSRSYGSDPKSAIFKERVLLTDPEGDVDFNGTRTPESIKNQYDILKEDGKRLGLDNETIAKTFEEVKYDVRDGFRGYNTYIKTIKDLQEQIDEGLKNETNVDELINKYTKVKSKLEYLYKNQVLKLGSLARAAAVISLGNKKNVPVFFVNSYNTKRPFIVKGYNLFLDRIGSGTGVYGVIDSVKSEIAEMNTAMTELGITPSSDMDYVEKLYENFIKAVSDIKNQYDYEYFTTPDKETTELNDKKISHIKKALKNPSDKNLHQIRKELSTPQLEQAIEQLGEDSKEAAVLQNIIEDRTEAQKIASENATAVNSIKKKASDNKAQYTEEQLNGKDIIKLRRYYATMLRDVLTELRTVYSRNSSDTELKELVDYYNTFADKIIEKGKALKLESLKTVEDEIRAKQQEVETKVAEDTMPDDAVSEDVVPDYVYDDGYYDGLTEDIPYDNTIVDNNDDFFNDTIIDNDDDLSDNTEKETKSVSETVSRKVFSSFDIYLQKFPKLRTLLSTANFDKEAELTDLLNQHEAAIEEYNRLLTVERKTWEEQLITQQVNSAKNKDYLQNRIDIYTQTVLDFNKRIRTAQRRLKKLENNGFTDEANIKQIEQIKDAIDKAKNDKTYKNALKQIKSLNTRVNKYFLTEKELIEKIRAVDRFYGREILPLERKIQDIITKSENNISKEIISSTFEILQDGKNLLTEVIDFNEEVEVSEFAESVLANDLVNTEHPTIKKIISTFQSIAPTFGSRNGLVKYFNKKVINDKNVKTSYLFNAPHTQLLYTIIGKTLVVNPNVAVAIHLGLHQYLTHIDLYREFHPTKVEELEKIFGAMNESPTTKLDETDAFITSAFISAFGIPRSTIVNAIGDVVLRYLGIVATDNTTVGFHEKLSAAFGEQALVYAEKLGYITNTQVMPKSQSKYVLPDGTKAVKDKETGTYPSNAIMNPLNNPTNMVKFNFDPVEVIAKDGSKSQKDNRIEAIKRQYEALEALTLDNIYSKKPQPFPSKLSEDMMVRNTKDISPVAKLLQEKVFSKLFNAKYKINYELVDLILENRSAIEDYLGLTPKDALEQNYIKDVKDGLVGVNQTITQQLDDLSEVYNWGSPYLYFKWYMSKNGRFFMDSTHVNMQQNKSLQRFVILPQESQKTFSLTYDKAGNVIESQAMKEFYYAIAQAFDSLGKHEDVEAFAKKILDVPAAELMQALFPAKGESQTLFGKNSKYGIKKLENFGQTLLTIQAIRDFQNASKKKQSSFKTWVSVENDSTTSAFFIGMLQHPYETLIKSLGPKVGVVDSDNKSIPFDSNLTISHMKKTDVTVTKNGETIKERFLDIYQTIASKLRLITVGKKGEKDTLHTNLWKAYFALKEGKYAAPEYNSLVSYGIENVKTLYSNLLPALPEAALDGVVSSALRTLVKSPTMTYLYGQGKASLMKQLGQELTTSLLTQFCDAAVFDENSVDTSTLSEKELAEYLEEKKQREAVLAIFDNIAKHTYDGKELGVSRIRLREMLIKQYSTQIRLRLENRNGIKDYGIEGDKVYPSLYEYLSNTLAATYGSAVMDALDESFGSMLEINQSKNIMFNTMFDCFEQELTYELEKKQQERTDAGEKFTRADEQEVIKSLFDVMPAIRTLYDNAVEQSVLLIDTEKMTDSRFAVNAPFTSSVDKGKITLDSRYSYANIRKFINSGRAGAVLPIHFLDGTAMAMMLDKYGKEILPLHDAIQVNAIGSTEVTRDFNRINYLINKEYDLYDILIDRFREVIDNTQKRREARGVTEDRNKENIGNTKDTIWRKFFGITEEFIDEDGNVTKAKRPPTVEEFYNKVLVLQTKNTANRNKFYNELGETQRIIANIDGPPGAGWVVTNESLKSNAFLSGILNEENAEDIQRVFGSDPNTFTPIEKLNELNFGALTDVNVRVQLLHELNKMDGNRETKSHMEYLEELVKKIDLKALTTNILNDNLRVEVYRTTTNTARIENEVIKIGLSDNTRGIPFIGQSGATLYTHELVHAAYEFIINNNESLGVNREIQELLNLQKQAMDTVSWSDFMPANYDKKHEAFYEQEAKKIWDYIFNNRTSKYSSLHEFLAYAMTNPVLREKLANTYVNNKKNNLDKLRLLDRIIALGSALLDAIRGKGSIKNVTRATANLFGSTLDLESKVLLLDRLDTLMERIAHTNNKSVKKLHGHPIRAIESITNVFANMISWGNRVVSPKLAYVANIADETGYSKKWNVRLDDTWLDGVKAVANVIGLLAVSRSRRQTLIPMLNALTGFNQQGVFATVWKEMQEPDQMTSDLELISNFTKMTEQASKSLEQTINRDLREAFGTELKEHEAYSLTQTVLYTDLSSLIVFNKDGKITNMNEIMELLKNPSKIQEEIETIHNTLYRKIRHDGQYNWYINSAKSLAKQMVTNVGHEGTVLNATAIAEGAMTGNFYEVSEDIVTLIDKLTTLYALSITDASDLNIVSKLSVKGIENMLHFHDTFKKETLEENVVDKLHSMKGYTKLVTDDAIEIRYGSIEDKAEFSALGYELVRELPQNTYTGQKNIALYKRNFYSPKRRDGATFIITGQQAQGTTLMDSTFMMLDEQSNISKEKIYAVHDEFLKKAEAMSRKIVANMQSRILSMQEINNLGRGYTPILSPNGGASDFRINMSRVQEREILKIEENAIDILSKMYAQKNMKVEAKTKNEVVINFLKSDMEKNFSQFSTFTPDGKNFVRLQENSEHKFIKEIWKIIPKELKKEIKKADKGQGFWVRDEWLIQLFGAPTISINDAKVVKTYTTNHMKYWLGITEVLMKLVAYMAKQNIVIRFPAVLIGNVISNFNFSYSMGFSPAKVFKKTVDNARNVREYMDNKKALDRIKVRQRVGTATEAEIKRINWYQTKLESNPVHPLMEKGFYQSIVEDISMDEIETIGKISKPLSRMLKNHPKAKKVIQTLFLLEGNPYFDFMFQATQYSDFVSRATHYQLMIEKVTSVTARGGKQNPDYIQQYKLDKRGKPLLDSNGVKILTPEFRAFERQLTIDIWNIFINYDKPQSSLEQYANDMGLIMFTKFLKRIQHVIAKGFIQSPISSLLFLLSQTVVLDSSNIYDYVLPTRNLMWNVFNPISDNLVNAMIPVPIQYITDTGLFGRS